MLIPSPTFAMYEITSRALAQSVVSIPLDENFDLDAGLMLRKAKERKAKVIFLACPNNPTGNRFSDSAIRKIMDETNAAIVIDEAYFSFSGKTYLPLLKKYPNMILLRTLSKIGFAGLRIGVLVASGNIVNELNKIRLPYNINGLSQAVAVSALAHREYRRFRLLRERAQDRRPRGALLPDAPRRRLHEAGIMRFGLAVQSVPARWLQWPCAACWITSSPTGCKARRFGITPRFVSSGRDSHHLRMFTRARPAVPISFAISTPASRPSPTDSDSA